MAAATTTTTYDSASNLIDPMPVLTPQLSSKLTEVAGDDRTTKAISWIAQRWQLKSFQDFVSKGAKIDEAFAQSQVAALSQTIGEVLAGKLHPNFVVKTLQERLQIPQERARDIAHDVSREIFSRVRQELMNYYRITPQQKVAHPQSAELRRTDAEERGQEEAVKPSMLQSAELRRPNAEERRNEPPAAVQKESPEQTAAEPPFDAAQGRPAQTEERGKPSLAEQVEEGAFPRVQGTGDRGQQETDSDQGTGDRGQDTERATVPAPEAPLQSTPEKPTQPKDKPQSFDATQGKHFEPGPEQVIDLR